MWIPRSKTKEYENITTERVWKELGLHSLEKKRNMDRIGSVEYVDEETKTNQEIVDIIKDHLKFNKGATTEEITVLIKTLD